MKQEQNPSHNSGNNGNEQETTSLKGLSGIGCAFWTFVFGVIGLWVVIHDNVPDSVKSFEVFIASVFSFAIVIVIIVHAVMYYRQAEAMTAAHQQGENALEISERAYVGVRGIDLIATQQHREIAKRQMQDIKLTIENTGRLPADKIHVEFVLIILVPASIQAKLPNSLMRYYFCDWWSKFESTKLFRGNIDFEIPIPVPDKLGPIEWSQVSQGKARCIAQIRIDYNDGFRMQRADYAFRLGGKWIPWWAWTGDSPESRIAEEIERYPQYNT
jgi:hypothetical protein